MAIAILIAVVAAGLISGGAQIATNVMEGKTGGDIWRGVAGATLGAAAGTAVGIALMAFPVVCVVAGALASSLIGNGVDALEKTILGETIDWREIGVNTAADFAINVALGAVFSYVFPVAGNRVSMLDALKITAQNWFSTTTATALHMIYYAISELSFKDVWREFYRYSQQKKERLPLFCPIPYFL